MSEIISCASCGAQFDATGYEPGMQFECTGCGEVVTVPGDDGGDDVEFADDYYEEDQDQVETVVAPTRGANKARGAAGGGKGRGRGKTGRSAARGGGGGGARAVAAAPPPARGGGKGGGGKVAAPPARGGKGASSSKGGGKGAGGRAARGGRGGRGGGRGDDPRFAAADREESQKITTIVVSVVGGVVLLLGVLIAINNSGGGSDSENDRPSVSGRDNGGSKPTPAPGPSVPSMDHLRTDAEVQRAAERFINALQKGDQTLLDVVLNSTVWRATQQKENAKIIETYPDFETYMQTCWSATGEWHEYFKRITLTPTPHNGVWYFAKEDVGHAIYAAKYSFPFEKEWKVHFELKINPDTQAWQVVTYADSEYKGTIPTHNVVHETRFYKVPIWEYAAHKADYDARQRTPPAPWNVPTYDSAAGSSAASPGGDPNNPDGPGPSSGTQHLQAGELSGWAKEAIDFFNRRHFDRARELCGRNRVTKEISAALINVMIDTNTDQQSALPGQEAAKMLQTLYNKRATEYDFWAGPRFNKAQNQAAIQKWISEHEALFGGR